MSRKLLPGLFVVLFAAGGAGLYVGLTGGEDTDGSSERGRSARGVGMAAEVVDFPTLEGDTASLRDYRGQVVVLNLWGTWCPPCREEVPELVELQEAIGPRGGVVIGLAVDSGTPSEIREFAEEYGMNYPIWRSSTRTVMEHYRAIGYPTTLLIDREGVIRERYLGPRTAAELLEDLEPYLEG